MTTVVAPLSSSVGRLPAVTLHSGDRMTQAEFHRAYELAPDEVKAELIGGTVYVAASLGLNRGAEHIRVAGLLFIYQTRTPGAQAADNATVILGDGAEPQPDLLLRVRPEYGGRSSTTSAADSSTGRQYVQGPPELLIEIAHASRAIDLRAKRADYAASGVLEYLVYVVDERRLRWFDLAADRELTADADGVVRVHQFPGLWVDTAALAGGDDVRLMATLEAGLGTPAHAAFAAALSARRSAGRT